LTRVRSFAIAAGSLLLAACATSAPVMPSAPAPSENAAHGSDASAASAAGAPGAPAAEPLATVDALAARAAVLAPGMREVARGERSDADASPASIVREAASDTCVRVALAASPGVRASLVTTRAHVTLTEATDAGDAPLGASGPVCVRRGDGVELRLEGAAPWRARFVAWQSGP
jgi:hypothetical protein